MGRHATLTITLSLALGALSALPGVAAAKVLPPREGAGKDGKLRVLRSVAGLQAQLTEEGGARHLLVGSLQAELLRLNGHRLRVWGEAGKSKAGRATVAVKAYEILDAGGGQKPLMGLLRSINRKLVLQRKEGQVAIRAKRAFLRRLKKKLNCKVWIVGELDTDTNTLSALRFGWLSCKKPRPIRAPKKETGR